MLGIGIDTGGTCTDAVVYDTEAGKVLATAKSQTTHEALEMGIGNSIGKLPMELVERVDFVSLSTTLATNACVERKGGRVCMIFIEVSPQTVKETYQNYGFESTEFMKFLPADVSRKIEPDWNLLESYIPEIMEKYDSVAISQLLPRENNGGYEKKARDIIRKHCDLPVVCAYEIFKDLNAIKRGAGALLNARLIPVMQDFFRAIHRVLEEKHIKVPVFVMRSDGGLVSEEYSMKYPVETLLCGPTASVKGAMELMPQSNAIIVDMGGTTSDIAIVENGQAVVNNEGVKVGDWQTFVKGVEIDTFALGGDTHVSFKDGKIFLGNRRVLPISMLAVTNPEITEEIRRANEKPKGSSKALYEHFVLTRSIEGREEFYDESEKKCIEALKKGPLSMSRLAEAVGADIFTLKTDRLETEGIIMRSGFTPSDAMAILGDRSDEGINLEAAEAAAEFIGKSTEKDPADIPGIVYDLVKERLYCQLVRIGWQHDEKHLSARQRQAMSETIMDFARESFWQKKSDKVHFQRHGMSTDAVLVGVGAPVHVFIKDVADMLGTKSQVSEYSGVTNALGAMLGDVCTSDTVEIGVDYSFNPDTSDAILPDREYDSDRAYIVYGDSKYAYYDQDEAIEAARNISRENACQKALSCGAREVYQVTYDNRIKSSEMNYGGDIMLGISVTAQARGTLM